MSEQTDPLAQLILDHRERHPLVGVCRCGDFDVHDGYPSHLADAIRAAVLADPTIVGMERVAWESVSEQPLPVGEWATVTTSFRPNTATALYRTPEVKG